MCHSCILNLYRASWIAKSPPQELRNPTKANMCAHKCGFQTASTYFSHCLNKKCKISFRNNIERCDASLMQRNMFRM